MELYVNFLYTLSWRKVHGEFYLIFVDILCYIEDNENFVVVKENI
jgi:hypothetical protein